MKRTKEWWAALDREERSWLVNFEREGGFLNYTEEDSDEYFRICRKAESYDPSMARYQHNRPPETQKEPR